MTMFPMIMNKGAFTRFAERNNMTVAQAVTEVENNPSKYSKITRKRARLAKTLREISKKRKRKY